ncbi:MAG: 1-deoxy-D-xylulose-5-phosphate synthase [Spirochaetaceae bacterium]|nr:MAG: 1-deoxy-D-xylulose-5-phosphate synthase [Spirochaetaceae bacterium]
MKSEYSVLPTINSVEDLKRLPEKYLPTLAEELRDYIVDVVSTTGGHLASNLGVVELTIALHRVFNSPDDKIIWDVGHQTYAHKILTGRRKNFRSLRQLGGVSGFPKKNESEHDIFETGHASTSISAALGILSGQELKGVRGNVIAVIGDGSLTGGMALEALNHAGELGKRLIIVLNDNKLSIGQNVGALSVHLTQFTTTRTYNLFRRTFDTFVKRIPFIGKNLLEFIYRMKRGLKAFLFQTNFFADLGYEYVGPINGHHLSSLIHAFKNVVKNFDKPTVIHVSTKKGKGYDYAESNPVRFHGVGAFEISNGTSIKMEYIPFTDVFSEALVALAEKDSSIVAITAAMAEGTGLYRFRERFPDRFFDVGICEQHAVTFAAGLAASGQKPVVAIYSTFMQRAIDQVIHDVALQKLPVVLAMDRAGLVGNDGETHHGVFDITLLRSVPNLVILSPASSEEMEMMLDFAIIGGFPCAIRFPRAECPSGIPALKAPLFLGQGVFVVKDNGEVLIVTLGNTIIEATDARSLLKKKGIFTDVYNLRFIKPLDEDALIETCRPYGKIVFIEDGVILGGIGEYAGYVVKQAFPEKEFHMIGVPDNFVEHGDRKELVSLCGFSAAGIAEKVMNLVQVNRKMPPRAAAL